MANVSPSTKRDLAKGLKDLLSEETQLHDNLLLKMTQEAVIYEQQVGTLKQISLQKQIMNAAQDKLNKSLTNIDILERSILKRNTDIATSQKSIEHLKSKVLDAKIQQKKFSDDELETMLKFKSMYGLFIQSGQTGIALSLEQLDILEKTAIIRKRSRADMLKDVESAMLGVDIQSEMTEQMMLQAVIQQEQNTLQNNQNQILDEQAALIQQQLKESEAVVQQWYEGIGFISEARSKLDGVAHVLKAMGLPTKNITSMMSGPWLVAAGAVLYTLKQVWGIFQELEKSAFEARKEMGMMKDIHKDLRKQAEELYGEYAHLGVTTEQVYKTQKAIANELGSTQSATKEIVTQVSIMSSQLGIAEETSVQFLKTMGQMGNTTAEVQTNMLGFAGALSNAAGVPFPQIMNDVAKASETTRTMMSKTPMEMIKAAVEARRLGTTLDKMTSSSRKLLNFSESISDEMEASVMLGKPINLQLARQLAYSGKIEESNKNILDIAKDVKFEQLDPLTMESFAKATGKSVDELKSMLQADREQADIKRKAIKMASEGNLSLQKQLNLVDELKKTNEAAAKAAGEDYNFKLKQQANQEATVALSNAWKKILVNITDIFAGPLATVLNGIASILGSISGNTSKWVFGILAAGVALKALWGSFKFGAVITKMWTDLVSKMPTTVTNAAKNIANSVKNIASGVGSGIKGFFKGIAEAIGYFGTKEVWKGAIGMALVGASLIPLAYGIKLLQGIEWKTLAIAGVALLGLVGALSLVGVIMSSGVGTVAILAGAAAVAILGAALIPAAYAASIAAEAFNKIIPGIVELSKISLFSTAAGIFAVGAALAAFGGGSAAAGLGAFVGKFLGGDPIQKLKDLAAIGDPLTKTASAISILSDSLKRFAELDSKKIGSVVTSLSELRNMGPVSLETDTTVNTQTNTSSNASGTTSPTTQSGGSDTTTLLQTLIIEIRGLRDDLTAGKIAVKLDGQLMATNMNRGNKFRGEYGAIA